MEENQKQLSIEIKPEVAKGYYSNLALIAHSMSEFIIDFTALLPGVEKPNIEHRIVMTPEHAKRLLGALQDNIVRYENQFGLIDLEGKRPGGTFNISDFPVGGGSKS